MTIGIYEIRLPYKNDSYVGSSINCERRKNQHFRRLKLGKHNPVFQAAYDRYGTKMEFYILCKVQEKDFNRDNKILIRKEQYYMDTLPGKRFNTSKIAHPALQDRRIAKKVSIMRTKVFYKVRKEVLSTDELVRKYNICRGVFERLIRKEFSVIKAIKEAQHIRIRKNKEFSFKKIVRYI